MHGEDLQLQPNEASDLCPLVLPELLRSKGWDRAYVTVLDETPAEGCIAVLAHAEGARPGDGWSAHRVPAKPSGAKGKTADAEACARRDGWIYVFGSQFGRKSGPLEPSRSWVARVREGELADALDGGRKAPLEVARLRFGLHRAVNDALADAQVELIERGPATSEAYIDGTIARGAKGGKRWAGRVRSSDHPVNVEAAEFRSNGDVLLGLRYPVTADGHPLLVELADIDRLFGEPEALPRCTAVWVLEDVGTPEAPAGVRALHTGGDDRFDVVVGDLDAAGKGATVLVDHPQGGAAESRHLRFKLPLVARGGSVATELVHGFGDLRRVEGVAVDGDGHALYVVDQDGQVAVRTLLLDQRASPVPAA
jgi:hypothetical protein